MYMPRPRWLWQAGFVWQAAVADLNLIITGSQISCISFNGLALTNKFAQVMHNIQILIFLERAHKYHSKDSAHKYTCPGRGDSDKQLQMWILSKCAHKYNSMAWRSQIYLSRSRRQWKTDYVHCTTYGSCRCEFYQNALTNKIQWLGSHKYICPGRGDCGKQVMCDMRQLDEKGGLFFPTVQNITRKVGTTGTICKQKNIFLQLVSLFSRSWWSLLPSSTRSIPRHGLIRHVDKKQRRHFL